MFIFTFTWIIKCLEISSLLKVTADPAWILKTFLSGGGVMIKGNTNNAMSCVTLLSESSEILDAVN